MFVPMVMLEQEIDVGVGVPSDGVVDPFVQLAIVNDAIDDLTTADLGTLDRDWFARYARSVDELTARLDAIGVAALSTVPKKAASRLFFFSFGIIISLSGSLNISTSNCPELPVFAFRPVPSKRILIAVSKSYRPRMVLL